MTEHEPIEQHSREAYEAYRDSVNQLSAAMREHVNLTREREGHVSELGPYFDSVQRLYRAALAFDEAEFDWCGSFPLGLDRTRWSDDEADDEDEPTPAGNVLTVLHRWDLEITDADAVVAAGRAAYQQAWPEETGADAALAVPGLARAADEVIHVGGMGALRDLPGLRSRRALTRFIVHEATGQEDWETDPFGIGAD